ncbi:hypothetical protein PENTCL1PPCAC_20400, partial [Pristionchus entomophagus]
DKLTPEVIEKLKAGRAKLKANPALIDNAIAKLNPEAQAPAKKFRDLLLSDETDLAKFHAAGQEIKAGLSDEVKAALKAHEAEIAAALGLPLPPSA